MQIEYRRIVRRPVRLAARIDAGEGSPLRDCTVVDISDLGARVAVDQAEKVPDEFIIHMAPGEFPRRKCRLVWRRDEFIGVEFDADWRHRG